MVFLQKVLRKIPGNWSFVIITDRTELDDRIYENFSDTGAINESKVQATSTKNLKNYYPRIIDIYLPNSQISNLDGSAHPVLSERDDIIVITDDLMKSI